MVLKNESDILSFLELKYHHGYIFAEGFVRLSSLRSSKLPMGQPVNFVIDTGALFSVLAPEDWETWDDSVMDSPEITAEYLMPVVQDLGFEKFDDISFRNWAWNQTAHPSVNGIAGDRESVKLAVCDFYFRLTSPSVLFHLTNRIVKCLPATKTKTTKGESRVRRRSLIGLSTLKGVGLCVDMRNLTGKIEDQPKLFVRETR